MTDPTDAGPGFLAFVAFFALAIVLWFLMRNMNARMRRMSYRQQRAHRGTDDPQAVDADLDDGTPEGPTGRGPDDHDRQGPGGPPGR